MDNEKSIPLAKKPVQQLNRSLVKLFQKKLLTLGVFVVLFAIFAHNFFTVRSMLNLLVQTSTFTILSIGATLVLIVGGVDFSLGAVIAFSGTAVVVFAVTGIPI